MHCAGLPVELQMCCDKSDLKPSRKVYCMLEAAISPLQLRKPGAVCSPILQQAGQARGGVQERIVVHGTVSLCTEAMTAFSNRRVCAHSRFCECQTK